MKLRIGFWGRFWNLMKWVCVDYWKLLKEIKKFEKEILEEFDRDMKEENERRNG